MLLFPIVQYNVLPLSAPQAESAAALHRARLIQPQRTAEQYQCHESLVGGGEVKGSNVKLRLGRGDADCKNVFPSKHIHN